MARWRRDDAPLLHRAIVESADHLRPWMAWIADEPLTVDDRRAQIARWEEDWRAGGDVVVGIWVDGAVAGGAGLHRRRGPGVLEIGYWVHPAFTRRGVATTAARLLTDAAFTVPGIASVEIHHDRANVVSGRVPRRLGFTFAGERPDDARAPAEEGIDCTWRKVRGGQGA